MLKIRLSRAGKKKQPSFRVIVQEHTAPTCGKFVEKIGYYRPAVTPKEFKVDLDRVKYWMEKGAQPSDTVAVLLKNDGMGGMEKYIAPRKKQAKSKKAVPEAPAAAPAAEAPAEAPVEAPAEEPAAEAPAPEAAQEEPAAAPAEEKTE